LAEVDNLLELPEYAAAYIQRLISVPSPEDWRNWILHISDELDDELFAVPFSLFLLASCTDGDDHVEVAIYWSIQD
jgi:hypothetical protein